MGGILFLIVGDTEAKDLMTPHRAAFGRVALNNAIPSVFLLTEYYIAVNNNQKENRASTSFFYFSCVLIETTVRGLRKHERGMMARQLYNRFTPLQMCSHYKLSFFFPKNSRHITYCGGAHYSAKVLCALGFAHP